jgi:hypothetical protein
MKCEVVKGTKEICLLNNPGIINNTVLVYVVKIELCVQKFVTETIKAPEAIGITIKIATDLFNLPKASGNYTYHLLSTLKTLNFAHTL